MTRTTYTQISDKFEGCLFGVAYGNAIGYFSKDSTNAELKRRLHAEEITTLAGNPDYDYITAPSSRATQLCIATANALIRAQSNRLEDVMREITAEYIAWLEKYSSKSASAHVTKAGIQRMKDGVHWSKSGDTQSRGFGATVRTAPIGLYFHDDLDKLVETARAVCSCTHAHPSDVASGIMTAYLVSQCIRHHAAPVHELLQDTIDFAKTLDPSLERKLHIVQNTLGFSKMPLDYAFPGSDPHGDTALTVGIYHFIRNHQNPTHAILQAATTGDYSRPVAAITATITGAYHGTQALPHAWFPDPHNFNLLVDLAEKLHSAAKQPGPIE